MCLTPLYLFFTMSSIVYLYSLYLHIFKLFLSVFLRLLLVLTVCTKGLRVTPFQFSVSMCCTCGRIDNKADFDLTLKLVIHNFRNQKYSAKNVKRLYWSKIVLEGDH